jgi:hypothetical protein
MNAERAHSSSSNFIHAEILCRKGTIQRISLSEIYGKKQRPWYGPLLSKIAKDDFRLEQAQAAKPVL